jgi:hypothetical protein
MKINYFISKTKLECLYHFTDERNLPLIRMHGLLPYKDVLERNLGPVFPGGNDWSHEADIFRGLHSYVHLCFKDNHPMEYQRRTEGYIGNTRYLRISPQVLHLPGVMACAGVANKSGSMIYPLEEALDMIDIEILFDRSVDFSKRAWEACGEDEEKKSAIQALRDRFNEAKKAEILIPVCIPTHLIGNL